MSTAASLPTPGAMTVTPSPRTMIGKTADDIARAGERAGRTFGKPGGVLAAVVLCVAMVLGGVVYTIITLDKNRPASVPDFATKDYVDSKFATLKDSGDRTLQEVREVKNRIETLNATLFQILSGGKTGGALDGSGR